jgi:hypothetical protein
LRLLRGLYGRDAAGQRSDDTPVFPVGFFKGAHSVLKLSYQEVRTVVRLVDGRTVIQRRVEQHVDSPAWPSYGVCAPANAPPHGLGTDPQYLGSFGHGRTARG